MKCEGYLLLLALKCLFGDVVWEHFLPCFNWLLTSLIFYKVLGLWGNEETDIHARIKCPYAVSLWQGSRFRTIVRNIHYVYCKDLFISSLEQRGTLLV